MVDALQRFSTGVYAAWYPIKDEREVRTWLDAFARAVATETLVSELWLYPRDSKVALNGSGHADRESALTNCHNEWRPGCPNCKPGSMLATRAVRASRS